MLKKQLIILIVLVCLLSTGCAINPVTGENQLMLVSEAQELQIGRQYAPEVQKQLGGQIENWHLQNYVNSVGQRIAGVSHMPSLEFHYTALNHDSINAMALPGGYVFITKGMLEQLSSEAQLAAVLSHETAHVTARHSAQAMSTQIGMDLALSVAGQKASRGAMDIAGIGSQLLSLNYSREQEMQADSFGLDYMTRASYDPAAMIEVIEMLEGQNRVRPIEFFSSHPNPANRKENAQRKMSTNIYPPDSTTGREDYSKFVLANLNN
jgi:predicted Zn-dependent protease